MQTIAISAPIARPLAVLHAGPNAPRRRLTPAQRRTSCRRTARALASSAPELRRHAEHLIMSRCLMIPAMPQTGCRCRTVTTRGPRLGRALEKAPHFGFDWAGISPDARRCVIGVDHNHPFVAGLADRDPPSPSERAMALPRSEGVAGAHAAVCFGRCQGFRRPVWRSGQDMSRHKMVRAFHGDLNADGGITIPRLALDLCDKRMVFSKSISTPLRAQEGISTSHHPMKIRPRRTGLR